MASTSEKLHALQQVTGSWRRVAIMLGVSPQSLGLILYGSSMSALTAETIDEAYGLTEALEGSLEERRKAFMSNGYFLVRQQRMDREGPGMDTEFS